MFSRNTVLVSVGLIFLSGMFLMGQDTWPSGRPDLTFDVLPSVCGVPPDYCDIEVSIVNNGTADAPASTTGIKIGLQDWIVYSTPSIPVGDSFINVFSNAIPDCDPCEIGVDFSIDHLDSMVELDEGNNTLHLNCICK